MERHSAQIALEVGEYMQQNESAFAAGLDLLRKGKQPIPQRIAWAFGKLFEKDPEIFRPYLSDIVDWLPDMDHDAERRNFTRILAHSPLPVDKLGELFEIAFQWLLSPQQPIAVRAWCMDITGRIAEMEPDLKREVVLAIEESMVEGSKGMKSHGKKWVKRLRQNTH